MGQDIKQTVTFNARPGVIFDMLLDSRKHAAFTGASAKVSKKVGGTFTCHGNYISGTNLDIAKNKRIVQAWRTTAWPKGAYSIATFDLSSAPGGKTKLVFTHVGVPSKFVKGITVGWKSHYWDRMKAYLKEKA